MDLSNLGQSLTSLSWQQFAVLALLCAVVDWAGAVIAAIKPPVNYFSGQEAIRVLETHVLKKVFPLAALAAFSQAIPDSVTLVARGDVSTALWAAACGLLGLYVWETIQSVKGSFTVAAQVAAEAGPTPGTLTSGPIESAPAATDPGDGLGAEDGISGDLPGVPGS